MRRGLFACGVLLGQLDETSTTKDCEIGWCEPPHRRHYQRIGLVCPEKRPIQTGFAYVYFERDVERIRAIALHNLHFMAHFRPGLVRYFHEKATAQSRVLPVSLAAIRQLYSRQTKRQVAHERR